MSKNNGSQKGDVNVTIKARHGIVPNLSELSAARMYQLINRKDLDEADGNPTTMWVGNVPVRGTVREIAATIMAMNERSSSAKIPQGWEVLLFRRADDGIQVRLMDRPKIYFTLRPGTTLPRLLVFMFAPLFKKMGMSQEDLDMIFPKNGNGQGVNHLDHVDNVDEVTAEVTPEVTPEVVLVEENADGNLAEA